VQWTPNEHAAINISPKWTSLKRNPNEHEEISEIRVPRRGTYQVHYEVRVWGITGWCKGRVVNNGMELVVTLGSDILPDQRFIVGSWFGRLNEGDRVQLQVCSGSFTGSVIVGGDGNGRTNFWLVYLRD
jgi:hypothetical protein